MKKNKKRALVLEIPRLLLVAERGLEPPDLRVMSYLMSLQGAIASLNRMGNDTQKPSNAP